MSNCVGVANCDVTMDACKDRQCQEAALVYEHWQLDVYSGQVDCKRACIAAGK